MPMQPNVTIRQGKLRGNAADGVAVLLGIPYAPPADVDRRSARPSPA